MAQMSRTGDAPAVGYPEWERPRDRRDRRAPEAGRWDRRRDRWAPRPPEEDDYDIEPLPARLDPNRRRGPARAVDDDEWGADYTEQYDQWPPIGRSKSRRSRPAEQVEEDDDEYEESDQQKIYIRSFISTGLWYALPLAGYAAWALTQASAPRDGCTNAFGLPCPAPRAEALGNLVNTVPQIAVALALSITIAMILGRVTTGWRPFAIGFASSVLGAGVATVLFAVLETQF
jgi:hypothetical protein